MNVASITVMAMIHGLTKGTPVLLLAFGSIPDLA
jgi:hypothetical protein